MTGQTGISSGQTQQHLWSNGQALTASLLAGQVFVPATAINSRELFAGRQREVAMVLDAIAQIGQHPVIYGERGVGKTSLASTITSFLQTIGADKLVTHKINVTGKDTFSGIWRKCFEDIVWMKSKGLIGFGNSTIQEATNLVSETGLSETTTPHEVRRALEFIGGTLFIFDEFDTLPRVEARQFTDLIKMLSDYGTRSTIMLVGVGSTIDNLIRDHQSVHRSIVQVFLPRMSVQEMTTILRTGEEKLAMKFENEVVDRIIEISQGLPHYAHLLGLHSVRSACRHNSQTITFNHFHDGAGEAVGAASHSVVSQYTKATTSPHRDALYEEVLLACAKSETDALGYFQAAAVANPLSKILEKSVKIASYKRHIAELCQRKRGPVLDRIGQPRRFRYRFRDPLLRPYILLRGSLGLRADTVAGGLWSSGASI